MSWKRGRIVKTGGHRHLLDQKGLYYAMWRQQTGERRDSRHDEKGEDEINR